MGGGIRTGAAIEAMDDCYCRMTRYTPAQLWGGGPKRWEEAAERTRRLMEKLNGDKRELQGDDRFKPYVAVWVYDLAREERKENKFDPFWLKGELFRRVSKSVWEVRVKGGYRLVHVQFLRFRD